MKGRRLARAAALQALYLIDVSGISEEAALSTQQESLDSLNENDSSFSRDLVLGTRKFISPIDKKIAEAATHWRIERMTSVDRNILRLSTYELSYLPDTPAKVVINEAIEIAREFSTEESARFVNGILDKISKSEK
jgi:N utilization substance protein B